MFTLTVLFGLFHGLVLLPVLLSIMGPLSSTQEEERTIDMSNNKLADNGLHRISSLKQKLNINYIGKKNCSSWNGNKLWAKCLQSQHLLSITAGAVL